MDPLRHASPDNNDPGHAVTSLRIDLGDDNMTPDPGVPHTAASARLGDREEGGLGQVGESGVSVRLCGGFWVVLGQLLHLLVLIFWVRVTQVLSKAL